jgi:hypothetical protein
MKFSVQVSDHYSPSNIRGPHSAGEVTLLPYNSTFFDEELLRICY